VQQAREKFMKQELAGDFSWLIYACETGYASEICEVLRRIGASRIFCVNNLPGARNETGLILLPKNLTPSQLQMPMVIPLLTPGYRYIVQAEARSMGALNFPTVVDSTAVVACSARLNEGTVLNALSVIGAESRVGRFVHVNRNASVGHHAEIADFVTLGPNCTLAGHVSVERGAYLGAGAVIAPKIRIGANAVVAMGAVVMRDVPPQTLVMGNPARIIRKNIAGYGDVGVPLEG
jgi:sugar O-acyltransferase (sialic acid O-acetyltransferase NeuD family)